MLSRIGKLASLVALLSALAPPVAAFHDPAPVLAEDTFAGNSWGAYRFQVAQPARIDLEVQSTFAGQPLYIGSWARTAAGQSQGGRLFGFGGAYVHAELMDTEVVDERFGSGSGRVGYAITRTFQPGEYLAVIAVASPALVRGTLRVFAEAGVTLAGRTRGTGAFLYLTPDFGGTANVSAAVGGEAGARAILEGSATQTVANRLFAWFIDLTFPASVTMMGYDGPAGSRNGSTIYEIDAGASGDYTFRVDASVAASVVFRPEIAAMGADVILP